MKKILAVLEKNKYLAAFIKHYTSSEMDMSSIAVAYYLLLTTFPLLIILANAFPYFNVDIKQLLDFLQEYLPAQLFGPTRTVMLNIFSEPSSSLLGFAILIAIWTMSRSLTHLQRGVNKAYDVSNHRDFLIGNFIGLIVSVLVLFLISFAFFISSFATVVLKNLATHYELSLVLYNIASNIVQPIMFGILVFGVALMYWVLPNVKIRKIRYIVPGTLFTTTVVYFLSDVIAGYVNRQLGRMIDFKFFGSVILFIMMLWFIFLARILMLGSVLNATYQDLANKGKFESRSGDILSVINRLNRWKAARERKKLNNQKKTGD